MATKRRGAGSPQRLDRDLMEQLLFGTGRARRFTQDSPVLPDVWLEYAKQPTDAGGPEPGPGPRRRRPTPPTLSRRSSCSSRRTARWRRARCREVRRAPARRAPDGGLARVRPRAGAAAPRRVQPLHRGRDAPLRGSGPCRAADDRVVASPHAGLDGGRHRGRDLAALARAGDQGSRASAGAIGTGVGQAAAAGCARISCG